MSAPAEILRVVVADDSYLMRQAVTGLIADEPVPTWS